MLSGMAKLSWSCSHDRISFGLTMWYPSLLEESLPHGPIAEVRCIRIAVDVREHRGLHAVGDGKAAMYDQSSAASPMRQAQAR